MTQLDQFESVFKSAVKERYAPVPVELRRALVVTDLEPYPTELLAGRVRGFLRHLEGGLDWTEADGSSFRTVQDLLQLVEARRPDLIVTYRNLHERPGRCPFGLGIHLDALTQVVDTPVLVLPDPESLDEASLAGVRKAMVVTGDLAGDDHLVSHGVRFTEPGGTLLLAHIEDGTTFARYLEAISKIQTIDTEDARTRILETLLKESNDYIDSCEAALGGSGIAIERLVRLGHTLKDYANVISEREIDLCVLRTKDEHQVAMHGLAYPIAVEVRKTPLLML